MKDLYEKTFNREKTFVDQKFRISKIWECELNKLRKASRDIEAYFIQHLRSFKSLKYSPPLKPREAFYGGRVNASKLYHEVGVHEKIYYYDFTSLYPYVCKRGKYPIGHPKEL